MNITWTFALKTYQMLLHLSIDRNNTYPHQIEFIIDYLQSTGHARHKIFILVFVGPSFVSNVGGNTHSALRFFYILEYTNVKRFRLQLETIIQVQSIHTQMNYLMAHTRNGYLSIKYFRIFLWSNDCVSRLTSSEKRFRAGVRLCDGEAIQLWDLRGMH